MTKQGEQIQSGWNIVADWIKKSKNQTTILPKENLDANKILDQMNLQTQSLLGGIVNETGGILVDKGWIRLFGSGSKHLSRTVANWNLGRTFQKYGEVPPYLFIGDDAVGGLFAINGGYLGEDRGNIYYFTPEFLEWVPLDISYSEFLIFCFDGNLSRFYKEVRWKGWSDDLKRLHADYAYTFTPYLWDGVNNIDKSERRVISMEELYNFHLDMKEKKDLTQK